MHRPLAERVAQHAREVTLEVPSTRWADIGGYEQVKVQQAVEWPLKRPELYEHLGVLGPPSGLPSMLTLMIRHSPVRPTWLLEDAARACNRHRVGPQLSCRQGAMLISAITQRNFRALIYSRLMWVSQRALFENYSHERDRRRLRSSSSTRSR